MGLSEQERAAFDEIERNLTQEDPRFVQRSRRVTPEARRGRRLKLSAAAVVVGFVLLLGIVFSTVWGFVGIALMFAGIVVGVRELQTVEGDLSTRVRALLGRSEE